MGIGNVLGRNLSEISEVRAALNDINEQYNKALGVRSATKRAEALEELVNQIDGLDDAIAELRQQVEVLADRRNSLAISVDDAIQDARGASEESSDRRPMATKHIAVAAASNTKLIAGYLRGRRS